MAKIEYGFVKSEFEKRGWILKSKEYRRNSFNLDAICDKGHDTTVTWANFRSGQGCRFCAGTVKYSYDKVKKDFEDAGCQLLDTEYKRNIIPMNFICSCGNKDKISYHSLMEGSRCRKCTAEKISKSLLIKDDDVAARFAAKGLKFIKKYHDGKRWRVEYECKCGNVANMSQGNLAKQDNCRKCGSAKISKENCYMWNEDRELMDFKKKMRKRMSNLINRFIDVNDFKKRDKTEKLLGYTKNEFVAHITGLLEQKGMTIKDDFHVDHKLPVDAFLEHGIVDVAVVNALENLDVLPPLDNLQKYNSYDENEFFEYVKRKTGIELKKAAII